MSSIASVANRMIWTVAPVHISHGSFRSSVLDGRRTGSIEERTGYAVLVGHGRGLEKGGSPGPTTDDGGSNQTGFDRPSSGGEHLGGNHFMLVSLESPCDEDHDEGKGEAQTDNNAIAEPLRQGGDELDLFRHAGG